MDVAILTKIRIVQAVFPYDNLHKKALKKPDGKNIDAFWETIPENSMDNQENEQINQCYPSSTNLLCVDFNFQKSPASKRPD